MSTRFLTTHTNLSLPLSSSLYSLSTLSLLSLLHHYLKQQQKKVWTAYNDKRHENVLETLRYFSVGRHVGFVCDRCGGTDFVGVRYKCCVCHDFDLCPTCQQKILNGAVSNCRFKYDHRSQKWIMVKNFNDHQMNHKMILTSAIPNLS